MKRPPHGIISVTLQEEGEMLYAVWIEHDKYRVKDDDPRLQKIRATISQKKNDIRDQIKGIESEIEKLTRKQKRLDKKFGELWEQEREALSVLENQERLRFKEDLTEALDLREHFSQEQIDRLFETAGLTGDDRVWNLVEIQETIEYQLQKMQYILEGK